MTTRRRRTFRLPGGIKITTVPLDGMVPARVLRQAVDHATWYLLWGQTYPQPEDPWELPDTTGPGGYLGCSAALRRELRAGVSLRRWSSRAQRLEPELAVLIDRPGRPLDLALTLFIEARLLRGLFPDWTMLNSTSGCPTSGSRLTRHQVTYGLWLTDVLLGFLRGRILPRGIVSAPSGGPIKEQLVRLVRASPVGPMTTTEVVDAASQYGIPISGYGHPMASVRRDLGTRERDSRGPTRVRRTWVTGPNGRRTCLFYAPPLSRAEAVRTWRLRHGLPVGRPRRRCPYRRP